MTRHKYPEEFEWLPAAWMLDNDMTNPISVPEGWIFCHRLFPYSGDKIVSFPSHPKEITQNNVSCLRFPEGYYAGGAVVKTLRKAWKFTRVPNKFDVTVFPLNLPHKNAVVAAIARLPVGPGGTDALKKTLESTLAASKFLEIIVKNMYGIKENSAFICGEGRTASLSFDCKIIGAEVSHDEQTVLVITTDELVILDNPLL